MRRFRVVRCGGGVVVRGDADTSLPLPKQKTTFPVGGEPKYRYRVRWARGVVSNNLLLHQRSQQLPRLQTSTVVTARASGREQHLNTSTPQHDRKDER